MINIITNEIEGSHTAYQLPDNEQAEAGKVYPAIRSTQVSREWNNALRDIQEIASMLTEQALSAAGGNADVAAKHTNWFANARLDELTDTANRMRELLGRQG